MRFNIQRWAQIGIITQLLAVIRILAEYLRLVATGACADATLHEYVVGALLAAVMCFGATILYFLGRFRIVAGVAVLTVFALLVYKFAFMRI